MILKQMLLFHHVYAHLFLVCNMFSLLEGMVGVTPLTIGPTASMTEETAVRPRSPPERYKSHVAMVTLPVSHTYVRRVGFIIFSFSLKVLGFLMKRCWMLFRRHLAVQTLLSASGLGLFTVGQVCLVWQKSCTATQEIFS